MHSKNRDPFFWSRFPRECLRYRQYGTMTWIYNEKEVGEKPEMKKIKKSVNLDDWSGKHRFLSLNESEVVVLKSRVSNKSNSCVEILLRNWWSCFTEYQQPPWGHVASIIKKNSNWRFFLFLPLPPLLATGPFVAALDGKRTWHLPPARTQEWRMHVLS